MEADVDKKLQKSLRRVASGRTRTPVDSLLSKKTEKSKNRKLVVLLTRCLEISLILRRFLIFSFQR